MKRAWTPVMLLVFTAMTVCGETRQAGTLRTWTNVDGRSMEAAYVNHKDGKVELRLPNGAHVLINAHSLIAEDRAWIKEEKARRNAPAGIRPAAEGYELSTFKGGEWSGNHAVYSARNFDACMDVRGEVLIHPKENGARIGKPMRLYVDCYYRDDDRQYHPIPITAYKNSPAPVKQPKTVTLSGTLRRDVPFTVTYEFSAEGIKAYGHCQDPRQIEHPTVYRLRVKVPPSHKYEEFPSLAEQKKILKDWRVVITPAEGKRRTFAYWESVSTMGGRNRQVVIDAPVYGRRRVRFKAGDPKKAPLGPSIYTGKSPWEGYSVSWTKDKNYAKSGILYLKIEVE